MTKDSNGERKARYVEAIGDAFSWRKMDGPFQRAVDAVIAVADSERVECELRADAIALAAASLAQSGVAPRQAVDTAYEAFEAFRLRAS